MLVRMGILLVITSMTAGCAFLPEPATEKDEDLDASGLTPLASGEWTDADSAHRASGTVALYEGPDGAVVHFTDFEATNGPDVYLYASPHPAAEDLADATKVPVPDGEGDGRATVRGDFAVPLPSGLDADTVASLVLWCDDFGVHFGTADLS